MAVYRRSRRHRFILLLLVLTSITILSLDYRGPGGGALDSVRGTAQDAFAPIQSAVGNALEPVGNFFSGVFDYGDLKAENERLRRLVDEARGQEILAQGAERERQALLDLLQLDYPGTIPTVVARVVTSAPTNFFRSVLIDRGSDDGLEVGMPVVTGAGLAGKLVDVSRERSTVLLLTDRSSSVGTLFTDSGARGVANGEGTGNSLSVDFVEPEAPVAVGEAVVTSGLQGSAFPPQLPIGWVTDVSTAPGALQQDITIDPAVNFERLDYVRVLLWRGD